MGESVEVTVEETESEPVTESGDQTIVVTANDNTTEPLVEIAHALGRIESRLDHLEERQTETQSVAETAASVASEAVAVAAVAVEEAETAADDAIAIANDAVDAASEPEQEPQREHWFFRPLKVSSR